MLRKNFIRRILSSFLCPLRRTCCISSFRLLFKRPPHSLKLRKRTRFRSRNSRGKERKRGKVKVKSVYHTDSLSFWCSLGRNYKCHLFLWMGHKNPEPVTPPSPPQKKKKKSRQVSLTVRQKLKIIRRNKGENWLIFTKLRSCELNISTTFIDTEVF